MQAEPQARPTTPSRQQQEQQGKASSGSGGPVAVEEIDMDGKLSWVGLEKFNQVQELLDQNKILINEINGNHEARTPEGLARNVLLIRELNGNVARVVDLYKDLSNAFEELSSEPANNSQGQQ